MLDCFFTAVKKLFFSREATEFVGRSESSIEASSSIQHPASKLRRTLSFMYQGENVHRLTAVALVIVVLVIVILTEL